MLPMTIRREAACVTLRENAQPERSPRARCSPLVGAFNLGGSGPASGLRRALQHRQRAPDRGRVQELQHVLRRGRRMSEAVWRSGLRAPLQDPGDIDLVRGLVQGERRSGGLVAEGSARRERARPRTDDRSQRSSDRNRSRRERGEPEPRGEHEERLACSPRLSRRHHAQLAREAGETRRLRGMPARRATRPELHADHFPGWVCARRRTPRETGPGS